MKAVVIMGSNSDRQWSDRIVAELEKWGIESVQYVLSAHKVPEKVLALLQEYNQQQEVVYLTVAGRSNALSGVIAANAIHPVIACPPLADKTDYLVNIHSTLQLPSATPVLTVLDPKNAALACLRIFGLTSSDLQNKIKDSIKDIKDDYK